MNKKLLVKILIVEGILASLALMFIAWAIWNKPLGPVLGLSTTTPMPPKVAVLSNPPAVVPGGEVSNTNPKPTPGSLLSQIISKFLKPSLTRTPLCGGPAVMTLLLVGSDERSEGYLYGLADSIRIIRIDFNAPDVMMVDIPRDLWVEIPGIADHYNVTHGKLNQAYFFGNPGMGYYDGPGEGPGLLARTLEQNFGVSVDHYLALDIKTFVRLIDSMGGIDINLDSTIDLNQNHDGGNPDYVLEAGSHHLDGAMALRLAMNRYPTIFQRAKNQNIVLRAIEDKLLTPAMLPKLPGLAAQFTSSVQTDLSPNDINKLLCISQHLTKDHISTVAFPDSMFTGDHIYDPYRKVYTYIMDADFNQIQAYMVDFMQGTWPK
jgi:LCP family protein required for cell wall assembly